MKLKGGVSSFRSSEVGRYRAPGDQARCPVAGPGAQHIPRAVGRSDASGAGTQVAALSMQPQATKQGIGWRDANVSQRSKQVCAWAWTGDKAGEWTVKGSVEFA